jgi:hypothetical protein
LGNYLGWVLAGLYLLPLDLKIRQLADRPFLRIQDDYLIFCKNKKTRKHPKRNYTASIRNIRTENKY